MEAERAGQGWQTLERQLEGELENQLKRVEVENVISPLALTFSIGGNPSEESNASVETVWNSGNANIATPSPSRTPTTRLNGQVLQYVVNAISNQKTKSMGRLKPKENIKQMKEPLFILIKSNSEKQREVQRFSFEYKSHETASLAPMVITQDENCNQNLSKVKGVKVFSTDMTPVNQSKMKENWDHYYRGKNTRDRATRATSSSLQAKNLTLTSEEVDDDQDL